MKHIILLLISFSLFGKTITAQTLAAGYLHALAVCNDSSISVWGSNSNGQLGNGNTLSSNTPLQLSALTGIRNVAGGSNHSLAAKSNGTAWAWGWNSSGQLGNGTYIDNNVPVQVTGLSGVVSVAAGYDFSLALKSDGTVRAWGNNTNGQLGNGTSINSNVPVLVSGLTGAIAIAAGGGHGFALKSNGTLWAWGSNSSGELGNGTYNNSNVPVQVSGLTGVVAISAIGSNSVALKSDSTVWVWGMDANSNVPIQVSGLTSVVAISAGLSHTMSLKANGTVWSWGYNGNGELGNGTNWSSTVPVQASGLTGVVSIAAGFGYSLALKANGTVRSWGTQVLGSQTYYTSNVPVQPTGLCALLVPCSSAPPQPGIVIGSATPCSGSTQTYVVPAVSGAGSYSWTLPSGWTGTSTTDTISTTVGSGAGNITVQAINGCGTSPLQTFTLTSVLAAPLPVISQSATNVLMISGSFSSYQWYFNGNLIAGATSSTYTAAQNGNYYVVVSGSNGCNGQSNILNVVLNSIIRYVKPAASGLGDGSSWANASSDLQAMITASGTVDQVWVAAGVYLPTRDPLGNSNPSNPRDKTFRLKDGVRVYGGFAGIESVLSARNIAVNITTLSGDLGVQNDYSDNCYHVVLTYSSGSSIATLDGFRIQYGNASGNSWFSMGGSFNNVLNSRGGGVYTSGATKLQNLHICNNSANLGGGVSVEGGGAILIGDSLYSNGAGSGGAIRVSSGSISVDSCAIYSNVAGGDGGGLSVSTASGTLSRSSVFNNTANSSIGGGLYINSTNFTCANNSIYGNAANSYWGGGIFYEGGNFGVLNVVGNVIYGNTAQKGAAIYHNDGTGHYSNNTFVNNAASIAGGISKLGGHVHLKNNIFWLNSATTSGADIDISTFASTTSFTNNMFQFPSTAYLLGANASGNIFATNPLLINVTQPLGVDNIPRTADDGLALSACSPAVNAGVTLSPAVPTDILGNSRVGNYDVGAYEYQGGPPILAGPISGDSLVCLNSTITLTNTVPGGTWSSSNTSVATVSSAGVVTGVALGTAVITYAADATGCPGTFVTRNIIVGTYVTLSPISGPDTVCALSTIQLSSSGTGGVWTSSNTSIATVSGNGVVTGVGAGTVNISYITGGTGCSNSVTKPIVVNSVPSVNPISGDYWVCTYGSPQYSSTTPGGVWSTGSNGIKSTITQTGVLTPVTIGQDTVVYIVTNSSGCQTKVSKPVYIVNLVTIPFTNISGTDSVCVNGTLQLSHSLTGGTWTSSNPLIATVSSIGAGQAVVTGVANGSATITYTWTNSYYGCSGSRTKIVTIKPSPVVSPISGGSSVCVSNTLQLSNSTAGGTWSTSSGGSIASVSTSGLITGISAGTDTVRYIVTNSSGCSTKVSLVIAVGANLTVNNIQGVDSLCMYQATVFTNTTPAGTWSSANPSVASISSTGSITAISAGLTAISYTVGVASGCSTTVTKDIYIKAVTPVNPVTGAAMLCVNSTGQYSNATPGGVWSTKSNGAISSISPSGLLTANAAGTDTVRYTVTTSLGCTSFAEVAVTVNAPVLMAITGADSICAVANTQLSHPIPGGSWTNFTAGLGIIGSTGLYSSLAPGIDSIYYQYSSNGCPVQAKKVLVVNALPATAIITGSASICKGTSMLLTPSVPGGSWATNNNSVASVNGSGQVSAIDTGMAVITYTITTSGCSSSTVHPISVNEAIASTSQNGATLSATGMQSGATYQWVDCNNNYQPIAGALSATFTASVNGQYAVVVSYAGCIDTSACLSVTGLGTEDVRDKEHIIISPNPSSDYVSINTGSNVADLIRLVDIQGKLIQEISPRETVTLLDIHSLAHGVYYFHIISRNNKVVSKLIVQGR